MQLEKEVREENYKEKWNKNRQYNIIRTIASVLLHKLFDTILCFWKVILWFVVLLNCLGCFAGGILCVFCFVLCIRLYVCFCSVLLVCSYVLFVCTFLLASFVCMLVIVCMLVCMLGWGARSFACYNSSFCQTWQWRNWWPLVVICRHSLYVLSAGLSEALQHRRRCQELISCCLATQVHEGIPSEAICVPDFTNSIIIRTAPLGFLCPGILGLWCSGQRDAA